MKAGAKEVQFDSSQRALDVCEHNVRLNELPLESHTSIQADAMEYLADELGDYDIVVLDLLHLRSVPQQDMPPFRATQSAPFRA